MDWRQVDQEIAGRIWTSGLATGVMDEISFQYSPRPTASAPLQQAFAYVGSLLTDLGAVNVHEEAVEVHAWEAAPAEFCVTSPYSRTYPCLQHVHTPSGHASGRLIDGGDGSEASLDRVADDIAGNILMVPGRGISGGKFVPYSDHLERYAARGPAAIVAPNLHASAGPIIECAHGLRVMPTPVVGVSYEAGQELREIAARHPLACTHSTSGRSVSGTCRNLAAEMGPEGDTGDIIVLSAHLDSLPQTLGTFDNLTGVAGVLEIANALKPLANLFQRTLRLLIFTGEEYFFQGSRAYVEQHQAELDRIKFAFNLDGLFPETAEGIAVVWSDSMRDYIDAIYQTSGHPMDVRSHFCMSSDYLPFVIAGVPAGRQADYKDAFPLWTHTMTDTPGKFPVSWVQQNAMVFAWMLARMLCDPNPLPSTRNSTTDVRCFAEAEDVVDAWQSYGFEL